MSRSVRSLNPAFAPERGEPHQGPSGEQVGAVPNTTETKEI